MREGHGQNWTPGRRGAPIGTREWADAVRLEVVSASQHLGEDAESFVGYMELMQEHRAWSLLTKHDGSTFRSREEFCAYKRPWGIGRPWSELRPYVAAGLAKRGWSNERIDQHLRLDGIEEQPTQAEIAAEAREEKARSTLSRHDGGIETTGLFAHSAARAADAPPKPTAAARTVERLRAINRAPEAVREAFKDGRISETLAAKLGPKSPSPEHAARVADIARAIVDEPDRKRVDAVVRERLGIEPPPMVRLDNDPGRAASLLLQRFGGQWSRDLVIALDALCHQAGK